MLFWFVFFWFNCPCSQHCLTGLLNYLGSFFLFFLSFRHADGNLLSKPSTSFANPLTDRFIVFSNISNVSSAFGLQTLLKGNIFHWVFNAQQHHVLPVRVKIILSWWHLLLLWASVAVRRQMSLFCFFYMRHAVCCSRRTTMTRSDRSNWENSLC